MRTAVLNAEQIVANYSEALKGPLAWIIRDPILFDADVLPYEKAVIKRALVECASQSSLTANHVESLGDLYFYLSYFIVGMNEREDDAKIDFFEEQRLEGEALRSEWHELVIRNRRSVFSRLLTSWFKPNA